MGVRVFLVDNSITVEGEKAFAVPPIMKGRKVFEAAVYVIALGCKEEGTQNLKGEVVMGTLGESQTCRMGVSLRGEAFMLRNGKSMNSDELQMMSRWDVEKAECSDLWKRDAAMPSGGLSQCKVLGGEDCDVHASERTQGRRSNTMSMGAPLQAMGRGTEGDLIVRPPLGRGRSTA